MFALFYHEDFFFMYEWMNEWMNKDHIKSNQISESMNSTKVKLQQINNKFTFHETFTCFSYVAVDTVTHVIGVVVAAAIQTRLVHLATKGKSYLFACVCACVRAKDITITLISASEIFYYEASHVTRWRGLISDWAPVSQELNYLKQKTATEYSDSWFNCSFK